MKAKEIKITVDNNKHKVDFLLSFKQEGEGYRVDVLSEGTEPGDLDMEEIEDASFYFIVTEIEKIFMKSNNPREDEQQPQH